MGQTSEMHIEMQNELFNTIRRAEEGEITMLDALISLEGERKQLEISLEIVKSFKNDHINEISDEAGDYKEGYKGYIIEVRNGRKVYKYDSIPEWQRADAIKTEVEGRYKAMLDAKIKGVAYANISEDGEELPLPEISYSKSSIILKKNK
jgi:hypothetical protein